MASPANYGWIVERAKNLGFDLCGIVQAEKFPELSRNEEWLARGYSGEMKYLHDARRGDPRQALVGTRSVIVCAINYNTAHPRTPTNQQTQNYDNPRAWISRYAWGDDYHEVLRAKLENLLGELRLNVAEPFEARIYADTGPVHERALAKYAGLGWLGKNTLLLNEELGSFFFLGVILTTLEMQPSLGPLQKPPPDRCGTCRRCLDACPTGALVAPYLMDARRCISYLTIELRGSIPVEFREQMGGHVFGCDICQDVCPWNRDAPVTGLPEFQPRMFSEGISRERNASPLNSPQPSTESLFLPRLEWLASLSESDFQKAFRGSAIKRTKWRGLIRNACTAIGNLNALANDPTRDRLRQLLSKLSDSPDQVISESAQWGLARILKSQPNDADQSLQAL